MVKMSRNRAIIVGLFLFVVVGYLYYSPYMAIRAIKGAAETGDADKLSTYIDFPELRKNLKEELKTRMSAAVLGNAKDNPLSAIGHGVINAIVDPAVDSIVTPSGIASIIMNGKAAQQKEGDKEAPAEEKKAEKNEIVTSGGYAGFSTFVLKVGAKDMSPISVVLSRSGLVSWKVTNILLPKDEAKEEKKEEEKNEEKK